MINFLLGLEYDKLKAVSFSKTIAKNYNKYYAAFEDSENVYTDCTLFIEYMLSVIRDSIGDALGDSSVLDSMYQDAVNREIPNHARDYSNE